MTVSFGLGLDLDSNLFGLGLDLDSNLFGLGLDLDSNLFGLGLDLDSNLFGLGLVLDSTKVDLTTALVLGGKTLVGNHRGQTFLVVGHQVCTHLRRDFVPLLFAYPL